MKFYKGRGAVSNPDCRFHETQIEPYNDGWDSNDADVPPLRTTVIHDTSRSILARNQSPDLPFDRSINPYRGCEHGCVYCYARPTHAYLGFSPGLDFESRLVVKPDAAQLLRKELVKKSYQCRAIGMGTNTDPYQPIERQWRISREILEVLWEFHHPLTIVTKSSLIERDIDLLALMAEQNLVSVMISLCTLERDLARRLEPRAASPQRRVQTMKNLVDSGIPVGVMVAPLIPVLNDSEIENILETSAAASADVAAYVVLRLPLEVRPLFEEWLETHYPQKKSHVMNRIREVRGGKLNDSRFGSRLKGTGDYANVISQRFKLACKRFGFNLKSHHLDINAFKAIRSGWTQQSLF